MADSRDLPTYVSGLLWAKANRAFRLRIGSSLEKYSLTLTEWALLGRLYESKSNGVHLADLAAALSVEPPLVTTMVSGLEKKGLVLRKEDIRDRRAKFIYLTEKGRAIVPEIEENVQQAVQKLLSGLTSEQIVACQQVLSAIVKNAIS